MSKHHINLLFYRMIYGSNAHLMYSCQYSILCAGSTVVWIFPIVFSLYVFCFSLLRIRVWLHRNGNLEPETLSCDLSECVRLYSGFSLHEYLVICFGFQQIDLLWYATHLVRPSWQDYFVSFLFYTDVCSCHLIIGYF